MFLALFVKKGIFAYLTLKLTFWPWRWLYIIKIIQEMDCSVKITWKWGITLVPGFICWKKHIWPWNIWRPFCFCSKKFRPRVPKWHPADFCSGHPIVSESIIKHCPYRETRFSQNPLDYYIVSDAIYHIHQFPWLYKNVITINKLPVFLYAVMVWFCF